MAVDRVEADGEEVDWLIQWHVIVCQSGDHRAVESAGEEDSDSCRWGV